MRGPFYQATNQMGSVICCPNVVNSKEIPQYSHHFPRKKETRLKCLSCLFRCNQGLPSQDDQSRITIQNFLTKLGCHILSPFHMDKGDKMWRPSFVKKICIVILLQIPNSLQPNPKQKTLQPLYRIDLLGPCPQKRMSSRLYSISFRQRPL